jgi:hypothetical protein
MLPNHVEVLSGIDSGARDRQWCCLTAAVKLANVSLLLDIF